LTSLKKKFKILNKMKEINTKIGQKIKDSGLSQEYISYKVGISIFTLKNWIRGFTYPDIDKAKKLVEILGLKSIDELTENKIDIKK